ncbi:hypothetical protein [Laspinema olomoucense]|uniref:Uncharacterized protein n=1 Tax=Laspinema olomoucense D3b TaxID=2953688 RepID=A0ABT2NFZ3_9CYAN|nr:hypothetical protein [Laspinema sp. D3b]MCT7981604.1 hypothetical protein [Laspinema sp. D3b]
MTRTIAEIYRSEEYQSLSGEERYRIDSLPSEQRIYALHNIHLYREEQGRVKGVKEEQVYSAFSKLSISEQQRINSLNPVARLVALRSLVKK